MTLREPPYFEHLLFENPWPAIIALSTVCFVLVWLRRTRGNRRSMVAAAVCLLLAFTLGVTSALVDTTRERMIESTQRLLAATAPLSMNVVRSLLDPQVVLVGGGESRVGEQVFAGLAWAVGKTYTLESHSLKDIAAEVIDDNHVRILIDLVTVVRHGRGGTRWLFDWQKRPDGVWRIVKIEWLANDASIIGITPNLGYLPRVPADGE